MLVRRAPWKLCVHVTSATSCNIFPASSDRTNMYMLEIVKYFTGMSYQYISKRKACRTVRTRKRSKSSVAFFKRGIDLQHTI